MFLSEGIEGCARVFDDQGLPSFRNSDHRVVYGTFSFGQRGWAAARKKVELTGWCPDDTEAYEQYTRSYANLVGVELDLEDLEAEVRALGCSDSIDAKKQGCANYGSRNVTSQSSHEERLAKDC